MHEGQTAKELLKAGNYTCVLKKDDVIYTSTERGIKPLVGWLKEGRDMHGFSAADKIVGKAAALLFVLAGVHDVYAPVMSAGAVSMFRKYDVDASYDLVVSNIINRTGDDICPMEKTVAQIDTPDVAFEALQAKIRELAMRKEFL